MDLQDMPPHEICYELDRVCPGYWFSFTGIRELRAIHVAAIHNTTVHIARFEVNEENPLEYVLTKIILQFSGGTS